MTSKLLVSLLSATLLLSACANPQDDVNARMKAIQEKTRKDLEDIEKSTGHLGDDADEIVKKALIYQGGDPGTISLQGVLVARRGSGFVLDPRITASRSGGKGVTGEEMKTDGKLNLLDRVESSKPNIADSVKTYVNVGCTDLVAGDTENLKEIPLGEDTSESTVLSVRATRVFICGELKNLKSFTSIMTDSLILKDAKMSLTTKLGTLSIITKSLNVSGASTIQVKGEDSGNVVIAGPSIHLAVSEELRGQGELKLETLGGDFISTKRVEMSAE